MSGTRKTYEVGFGKPPQASRFKKGQSGNPAGRKKGSRNLASLVRDALEKPVKVTSEGRTVKRSLGEVAVAAQAKLAAQGNTRAFLAIAKVAEKAYPIDTGAPSSVTLSTASELTDADYAAALEAALNAMQEGRKP